MATLLFAALVAASIPGPDAAQISRLDFNEGMSLCYRYRHVVPCPEDAPVIADVRCEAEADGEGRISCTSARAGR